MINVRQNVFDRMVSAVSPAAGVRRMQARVALAAATALTDPGGAIEGRGGYRGAQPDRRQTRGWRAKARSANADTLGNREVQVARSRDAAMNMPLATAAIERPITFTVGTGLMAIPELNAQLLGISEEQALTLSAQIASDYDEYMSSKDPDAERRATGYDQQEIVLRGVLESGDILGVRVMPQDQPGRYSETAWKLYEADRIASPAHHIEGERWSPRDVRRSALTGTAQGNVIAGGVEVDGYTAAVAYHVLKSGKSGAANLRMQDDTVRIPAWGEKSDLPTAIQVMSAKRPEQFRGVSILAPVLEVLHQVSTLTEAELFAAVLQGMVAMISKSPGAGPLPEPDYGADGEFLSGGEAWQREAAGGVSSDLKLEAGTVWEIDSDTDVDLKSPGRPNPAFDPFFMALAKQIAAAIECPLEVLLLAFSSSYSASRGALEVFYITVRKRRNWLASHWCAPHYRAWLYEQAAKGRYRLRGFLTDPAMRERWSRVKFRGDGKISLDPTREAKALEVHEAHGWSTGADITAELNGGSYDDNVRRRAGEHKRFVEAGLPIPNAKGGGAAPASEHAAGEGDTKRSEDDE